MDWQTIVVALLGGLAGSVVGVVASTKQHRDDEDRLDRSAARVTFFELVENAGY